MSNQDGFYSLASVAGLREVVAATVSSEKAASEIIKSLVPFGYTTRVVQKDSQIPLGRSTTGLSRVRVEAAYSVIISDMPNIQQVMKDNRVFTFQPFAKQGNYMGPCWVSDGTEITVCVFPPTKYRKEWVVISNLAGAEPLVCAEGNCVDCAFDHAVNLVAQPWAVIMK